MHRDLGIGIAAQFHSGILEFAPQRSEVLDDPVVHHRDPAGDVTMRVGIAIGRCAVGGPAGVAHTSGAAERRGTGLGQFGLQIGQPTGLPLHRDARAVQDRHARGVVSPVLHAAQCVHDDAERVPVPDVANDSAHGVPAYLGAVDTRIGRYRSWWRP